MASTKKICVIGAGLSGMSMLRQWKQYKLRGVEDLPDVICLEKQEDAGGQWFFNWRSGTDIHGDPVHSSMYHNLFINSPKELLEFPDYTFLDHFGGKPSPSYLPRDSLLKYFQAYWKKHELEKYVEFNRAVMRVKFVESQQKFEVVVRDQETGKCLPPMMFDYVVDGSGCWSCPNVPDYPGIDSFPGEIIHTHNIRSFKMFKGLEVLIVGSSFSAEDAIFQLYKSGAKKIITSTRSLPLGYVNAANVVEKCKIKCISDKIVTFEDGTEISPDVIILATGYQYNLPHLSDIGITETGPMTLYPFNAYKGILSLQGGNNRLFHILAFNNFFIVPLTKLQAEWIMRVVLGKIAIPSEAEMRKDIDSWQEKFQELLKSPVSNKIEIFPAVAKYMLSIKDDLSAILQLEDDINLPIDWILEFLDDRKDFLEFRDKPVKSVIHGTMATVPKVPVKESFCDTDEQFRLENGL